MQPFAQTVIQPTPTPAPSFLPSFSLPTPHTIMQPDSLKLIAIVIAFCALLGFVLWAADQLLAPISAMQHGMVGIIGKRGAGKSFTAVTYARRWRNFNPHKPVYTNLEKLELPGDGPIYLNCTHEMITKAYDGLLLIDEAGVWLNAWNFVDRDQRKVARWIAATRHYKVMVILTAHAASHINVRVRSVVDEWIVMTPFTTLKLFRGKYYESESSIGRKDQVSHTVWVPMWPTVCKSYNTDSLHRQATSAGVDMVGSDAEIPGMAGIGSRGNDALKPPDMTNGYSATIGQATPQPMPEVALSALENDPSKLLQSASSKSTKPKVTTTIIDVEPEKPSSPVTVRSIPQEELLPINTTANPIEKVREIQEWEIWVNNNATESDLQRVRLIQSWFNSNGGEIYEIELPNVGAYLLDRKQANSTNHTNGIHYDSRTLLQKLRGKLA